MGNHHSKQIQETESGNRNAKRFLNEQKVGFITLPAQWESIQAFHSPNTGHKDILSSLPAYLLCRTDLDENSPHNVPWNGYGYGDYPGLEAAYKEDWEKRGRAVLSAYSKQLHKNIVSVISESNIAGDSRISESKSSVPKLEIRSPRQLMDPGAMMENKRLNKLYKNQMPMIPEESFNFLQDDHPVIINLRRKENAVPSILGLNKKARAGLKQKKMVTLKFDPRKKWRSVKDKALDFLEKFDRELEGMYELGNEDSINSVYLGSKANINLEEYSVQVIRSALGANSRSVKTTKATSYVKRAAGEPASSNIMTPERANSRLINTENLKSQTDSSFKATQIILEVEELPKTLPKRSFTTTRSD